MVVEPDLWFINRFGENTMRNDVVTTVVLAVLAVVLIIVLIRLLGLVA